ncbi:MAG: hypothetical protein K2H34_11260, partial [Lachnospiraceae bacterium]|nr:hypothetical protein [Lachnospiraceae bacterium]
MAKNERNTALRIVYFLLIAMLIVVVIVGDLVIFKEVDVTDASSTLKAMMMAISIIEIILSIILSVVMSKFVADQEKVSLVKSDKYKKLFLNLPVGFAQAQILREAQSGRNMGYRITDANETFGKYFNLDLSDYYGKIISESPVEVLQDINAWFEAYNNSGTKLGELLTVEITMEKLDKVFNTV